MNMARCAVGTGGQRVAVTTKDFGFGPVAGNDVRPQVFAKLVAHDPQPATVINDVRVGLPG